MAAKDSVNSEDLQQLAKLAVHGCYNEVRQLATAALVKARDERGRTVLMLAADVEVTPLAFAKCVELFLHLGADPSAADTAGDAAAHLAAKNNNLRMLAVLPFNAKWKQNGSGLSPLMVAAQAGKWACAKHLLYLLRQVQYNEKSNEKRLEMMQMKNRSGWMASDLARDSGHSDLARVIDLEMRLVVDEDGRISGLSASEKAERQELQRLARAGDGASLQRVATRINCDLPDINGRTALWWAAARSSCDEASLQMLGMVADPTCAAVMGVSCLHLAAQKGSAVLVRVLMAAGAHANARYENGLTPLMLAAMVNASPSVAPMLLPASDWGLKDHEGKTALDWATSRRRSEWVALLRGYESKSYFDESPMMPCCRHSLRCLAAESVARLQIVCPSSVQLPPGLVDFVSRHGFGQGGCSSQFSSDD